MSKRTIESQAEATSCGCGSDDSAQQSDGGSLIAVDVGTGSASSGTGGSLVDLDVATGGDTGSLIDAQVAGGSLLDASVGTGDDYSGLSLKVATLADQGLLDLGSDSLATVDVDTVDLGGVGSLLDIGHIGLPDLTDIGGILDSSSC